MSVAYTHVAIGSPSLTSATASVTAPAGALLMVGASFYAPDFTAPSGSGLTFTLMDSLVGDSLYWRCRVPGGGFSGTVTIPGFLRGYAVGYWTGQRAGGSNGAAGIAQQKDQHSSGTDPFTVNYDSAFGDPNNGAWAYWFSESGSGGATANRSGWVSQGTSVGTYGAVNVQSRVTSDTAAAVTFGTGTGITYDLQSIEVIAATGPSIPAGVLAAITEEDED